MQTDELEGEYLHNSMAIDIRIELEQEVAYCYCSGYAQILPCNDRVVFTTEW